jgi:hypothetical protein
LNRQPNFLGSTEPICKVRCDRSCLALCSVEDAMDSATCDKNLAGNLETLRHVAALPRHCSSHSVVKITSFVPLPVLERAR